MFGYFGLNVMSELGLLLKGIRNFRFLVLAGLVLLGCLYSGVAVLFYRPGPPQDSIAFAYRQTGAIGVFEGIFAVSPDGSNRMPLFYSYPTPSQVVMVLQSAPEALKDILKPAIEDEIPYGPSWSAFGRQITYRVRVHGKYCDDIFTLEVGGRRPEMVTCLGRDSTPESISWSPNGVFFAFTSRENNTSKLNLVDTGGLLARQFSLNERIWGIAWSPDSTRIAATVGGDSSVHIYFLDDSVSYLQPEGKAFGKPAWSPDGESIAFLCLIEERYDICTMGADGSNYHRIKFPWQFPYLKNDLHWSPDGEHILFVGLMESGNDLFVVKPDGSDFRQLTTDPADDSEPDWSPDGSKIAFVTKRDGNREIYIINADGTDLTRVTNSPGDENEPVWRPLIH